MKWRIWGKTSMDISGRSKETVPRAINENNPKIADSTFLILNDAFVPFHKKYLPENKQIIKG